MKWPEYKNFDLEKHTILLGYRGSISHGTYIPSERKGYDDKDVIGIVVPPLKYTIGLSKFEQVQKIEEEWDTVLYEIRKMFKLLLSSNPNVLSLLYLGETDYLKVTELGQRIIDNREIFISKQIYHSFSGYAYSKLKGLEKDVFNGYMGEKRKELVKKVGYDSKNASHLIRLLRMGREFLTEGTLYVKRKDAAELIDIKQGKWSLERVKAEAEKEFDLVKEAHIHSSLPNKPDFEKAEQLCIDIIRDFYHKK